MIPEYTVIVPAFNEEEIIRDVLVELGRPEKCREVIVVNDGSSDRTEEVCRDLDVRVISSPRNRGYGASLKIGANAAQTEYVITFDADGQHDREDLLKIARVMKGYDMVVGARDKDSPQQLHRAMGKSLLWAVANLLAEQKIPDLNSGLRAFRRSSLLEILSLLPDGFSASTTSTIAMFRMGYAVHYVPISANIRRGSRSSVRFFKDGFSTLMLIINLTALFNPMRVFLPLAFFFIALSLGYFIYYAMAVRLHVTSLMVLLFITGVLLFFMGIVCEQVSAIRRELRK